MFNFGQAKFENPVGYTGGDNCTHIFQAQSSSGQEIKILKTPAQLKLRACGRVRLLGRAHPVRREAALGNSEEDALRKNGKR